MNNSDSNHPNCSLLDVCSNVEIDSTLSESQQNVDDETNDETKRNFNEYERITKDIQQQAKDGENCSKIFKGQINHEVNEFLTIEHCYSKMHFPPQAYIESKEKRSKNIDNNNETSSKPQFQSTETGEFDPTFVSSMIEVVDSVKKNLNTNCAEEDSSSFSPSDSDDSDTDSTTSTSSSDSFSLYRNEDVELAEEVAALKQAIPPRVTGEILPSELPPVEDICLSLPQDTLLECIGKVSQITPDNTVVVQSFPDKPALDSQTILFFTRNIAIGRVDETFGPVPNPLYTVRFNNKEHLELKGVKLDRPVYFAPQIKDLTMFVFLSELSKIKGSDASWTNDHEPPLACLDYSDDEEEREAKKQRKFKNAGNADPIDNQEKSERTHTRPGRGRGNRQWHNRSTRINVADRSDDSQLAWQHVVSHPHTRREFRPPMMQPSCQTYSFQQPSQVEFPHGNYSTPVNAMQGFSTHFQPNLMRPYGHNLSSRWNAGMDPIFNLFASPPPPPPTEK